MRGCLVNGTKVPLKELILFRQLKLTAMDMCFDENAFKKLIGSLYSLPLASANGRLGIRKKRCEMFLEDV